MKSNLKSKIYLYEILFEHNPHYPQFYASYLTSAHDVAVEYIKHRVAKILSLGLPVSRDLLKNVNVFHIDQIRSRVVIEYTNPYYDHEVSLIISKVDNET